MKNSVLFIDDSDNANKFIELFISVKRLPIIPKFIKNALKGLEYLGNCTQDEFPDIIIVDINMPTMNGFEFIDVYKDRFYDTFPNTKLFITSSSNNKKDIKKAEDNPIIEGFIEKPLSLSQFDILIKPHLSAA